MESERPVHRMTNSFRHYEIGEPAPEGRSLDSRREVGLTNSAEVACQGGYWDSWCGWRWNGRKVRRVNHGDLVWHRTRRPAAIGTMGNDRAQTRSQSPHSSEEAR